MDHRSPSPALWLIKSHVLLLRAALLEGEPAVRAWNSWQATFDIDAIDSESFQLLPLLYLNLKRIGVAHPLMAKLRGIYKHTWFNNQVAIRHSFEVLQPLEAANVSVLLLNTLPLIVQQHCDPGAFQIRKVDLLVKIEKVDLVDREFQKAGWRPIRPLHPRNLRPLFHGTTYSHSDGTILGLNWRPFTIDCPMEVDAQLWKRGNTCASNGMDVQVPNVNDLLLLTCVRGFEGQLGLTPRSLAEAAILIASSGSSIDWEIIAELTRQIDKVDSFQKCLGYLRGELNVEVPKEFIGPSAQQPQGDEGQIVYQPNLPPTVSSIRSLFNSLVTMWGAYQLLHRLDDQKQYSVNLARFFVSYYQCNWGVRRAWMVPLVAVMRIFYRLRRSWRVDGHSRIKRNGMVRIDPNGTWLR